MQLANDWKLKNIRRDRVGLIRLGSNTHAFNFDQRYVGLQISGDVDTPYIKPSNLNLELQEFDVMIPHNSNLIPPGYYMLYIVSALSEDPTTKIPLMGTPSIARIVKIELGDFSIAVKIDIDDKKIDDSRTE